MTKAVKVTVGIVAGCVIVGVPVLKVYPGPSDKERIQTALNESIQASKEGRSGGVLEYLTDQFSINDQDVGNRRQIGAMIRDSKPDVEITRREPEIFDDNAKIVSPVRVKAKMLGQEFDYSFEDVTILFKKEPSRAWLVLPTHTWRLDKVYLPEGTVLPSFGM